MIFTINLFIIFKSYFFSKIYIYFLTIFTRNVQFLFIIISDLFINDLLSNFMPTKFKF